MSLLRIRGGAKSLNCSLDAWIAERCVRQPRISGGLAALCKDFNRWRHKHRLDECGAEEFRQLFDDDVIEVEGVLLVPGLGLKIDWISTWKS
jgi:hypothetical protein